ncbi:MAG: LytTR family DNA-binding domain-containing protein [Candidatus Limivivens sp.]|nr:LytTR family DNA-binding domain-containing protein [Candidatus Limivivens sp.]
MLTAIIIDDETLILDNLSYIFQQLDNARILRSYEDPARALEEYSSLKPDVVIVDINMPSMNGLEFAENLRAMDPKANIIFLTAYDQYAIDAFGVHAVDYILKPVTTSKLKKSLARIQGKEDTHAEQLPAVEDGGRPLKIPGLLNNRIHLLNPADVLYIEVNQRNVTCCTGSEIYQLKHNISYWEELLSKRGWFRCHRCFLINMNQVSEISQMFNNTYDVRLHHCSAVIPVGRTYANAFKKYLGL